MFVKKVFVQLNVCTFYFPAVFKEIRLLYSYSIPNIKHVEKIGKPVSEFQVPTKFSTPWALGKKVNSINNAICCFRRSIAL